MLPISPLALTHDVGRIQLREGDALCHFYSNMLYLCFFAQHIRLSKRALSCTLFVWGHHHTANSLKLSHVQIKPLILVVCQLKYTAVIDSATDVDQRAFSHFFRQAGSSTGDILSPRP